MLENCTNSRLHLTVLLLCLQVLGMGSCFAIAFVGTHLLASFSVLKVKGRGIFKSGCANTKLKRLGLLGILLANNSVLHEPL